MELELPEEEVTAILHSIQRYFREELDEEMGALKTRLMLEFFVKEIGPFAYNQGVRDAERFFRERIEDLAGSCHEFGLTYWSEQKKGRRR